MDKGKHWESLIDFLWKSQSARYLPGPAPKIPWHRRRQWIKNLPSAPGVCCFWFIDGNWAPKVVFAILVIHYIRNFPSSCQRNLLKKISCASVVDSLPNSQQLGVMKRWFWWMMSILNVDLLPFWVNDSTLHTKNGLNIVDSLEKMAPFRSWFWRFDHTSGWYNEFFLCIKANCCRV